MNDDLLKDKQFDQRIDQYEKESAELRQKYEIEIAPVLMNPTGKKISAITLWMIGYLKRKGITIGNVYQDKKK